MSIKERVPWYLKIPAKIALSRLPVSRHVWRRLGIFRHGTMDDPASALGVYSRHFRWFDPDRSREGYTVLEIGPGDSIASGLLTALHGGARTFLVDKADDVSRDMAVYRNMLAVFRERGFDTRHLEDCRDFEDLCRRSGTVYLTDGIASLRSIPARSVDFIFSNAVLEHVPRPDFASLIAETKRLLGSEGICSHGVDLRDHLAEGLNNLRFSDRMWESPLMARSGFYTNRIRYREMLGIFAEAGFHVNVVGTVSWDRLPTAQSKFASRFRALDEDDLRVSSFDVLLTQDGSTAGRGTP
jgi:SAM-dependent methyltransferase